MANKYEDKLKKYLKDQSNEMVDLGKCAKLKMKASNLKKQLSEKLYKLFNTTKKIDFSKAIKLIRSGADVNYKFRDGITLYMLSALNAQIDALEFLKHYGAKINVKNCYGQNALMLSMLIRNQGDLKVNLKYSKVIIVLKKHGVNLQEKDASGISTEDYNQGKTAPFTKTYLNNIKSYLKNPENVFENENY